MGRSHRSCSLAPSGDVLFLETTRSQTGEPELMAAKPVGVAFQNQLDPARTLFSAGPVLCL